MSDMTVKDFAAKVGRDVPRLLEQMKEAGLEHKSESDAVSEEDKRRLLDYLTKSHGGDTSAAAPKNRITLTRKTRSRIKTGERGKTIEVQVRKKRTYVKRTEEETKPEPVEDTGPRQLVGDMADSQQAQAEQEAREAEAAKARAAEEAAREAAAKLEAEKVPEVPDIPVPELVEQPAGDEPPAPPKEGRTDRRTAPPKKAAAKKGRHERDDDDRDERRRGGGKKAKRAERRGGRRGGSQGGGKHGFQKPTQPIVREVSIPESISVADLADKMSIKANEVIKAMFTMGAAVTINQTIDQDTAAIVVEEMGHKPKLVKDDALETEVLEGISYEGEELTRDPVVTVMGHVDHGKTKLLDALRHTNVQAKEAGGITQSIGAYQIATEVDGDERDITFIDTPGHEAFTAMRARGAKSTDIAVLVVAADDGVMPQTIEALNHAKAAEVPIVVAVNKVDKPDSDPTKVRGQLMEFGLTPEEYGGDTMFVDVSAVTRQGLDELLEAIILTADAALDLRANPTMDAQGVAIEAHLDQGRGPVATVLIQRGTLHRGDSIVAGAAHGRVRAMINDLGETINEAPPSMPVQVLGLTSVPGAGDSFLVVEDDRVARQIAAKRDSMRRAAQQAASSRRKTLEELFEQLQKGETSELTLILKGDGAGSVEALEDALAKIVVSDEVSLRVIDRGVGAITETNVSLAAASTPHAVIVGFNVRPTVQAARLADQEGVDIRYYSVIYDAIDEIEAALKGMLKPIFEEKTQGTAEIREVFRSSKFGNIAGCMVTDGHIRRNAKARLLRDGVVVFESSIASLRREKDDVTEVREGYECGMTLANYNDIQLGDMIETYEMVEKARD